MLRCPLLQTLRACYSPSSTRSTKSTSGAGPQATPASPSQASAEPSPSHDPNFDPSPDLHPSHASSHRARRWWLTLNPTLTPTLLRRARREPGRGGCEGPGGLTSAWRAWHGGQAYRVPRLHCHPDPNPDPDPNFIPGKPSERHVCIVAHGRFNKILIAALQVRRHRRCPTRRPLRLCASRSRPSTIGPDRRASGRRGDGV